MMHGLGKLRRMLLLMGFGGGALLLLLIVGMDRGLGEDVFLIVPHDPATVELNRSLFLDGDPVAEIYGNPLKEPVRVVMPDRGRLIRPEEDPSLLLLPVDKRAGENPLQARTLWFFAKFAVPGAFLLGVLGLLGLLIPARLRRAVSGTPAQSG